MPEPLTAQRLAEIKARRALVPHAPWHARPALTELGYSTHVVCLDASGEGGPEDEADVWLHGRNVASGLTGNHAEFVAHAPGDIDALLAEVERLSEKPAKVARWEPLPVGERAFRLVCDHAEIGRYHADGSVYVTTLTDGSFVGRWFQEHMARSHIEIAAAARGWTVEK